ncbi:hypothetical protein ACFB49_25420 [Sphingomonas sp. DBB INV C78]
MGGKRPGGPKERATAPDRAAASAEDLGFAGSEVAADCGGPKRERPRAPARPGPTNSAAALQRGDIIERR